MCGPPAPTVSDGPRSGAVRRYGQAPRGRCSGGRMRTYSRIGAARGRGFLAPTLAPLLAAALLLLPSEPLEAQCGGGGGAATRGKAAQLRSSYDKERDVTLVSVGPVGGSADAVRLSASYECLGKKPCAPGALQLVITAPGRFAQHEEGSEVELRAGEESLRFARTWYQAKEQPGGGVLEIIVLTVPAADFLKLAWAKTVECVMGSTRTYLTRDQRGALERMARRIEKEMKG